MQVRVIEPRRPGLRFRLGELWRYRGLIVYFGRRFLEKRYIRTWLGWVWIPLRPMLNVAARVFVFGEILQIPSEGVPYLIFFIVGMAAWELFDETLFWSARSLEMNRGIIRKIYVPRLTMLFGSASLGLAFFAVYVVMTGAAIGYYYLTDGVVYFEVGVRLLLALGGIGLILLLAWSFGLWLSVIGAQARDVRFSLRFFTGFWFFLTPVIYPISEIPDQYRFLASINPVTAPIEMIKNGVLGIGQVPPGALVVTFATILVVGGIGWVFFERSEAAAVDAV